VSRGTFSNSWHFSFPLKIFGYSSLLAAAEWKPRSKLNQIIPDYLFIYLLSSSLLTQLDPDRFRRCAFHNRRAAYPPSTFCVFTAHKMTTSGAFVFDLAGSGNLDSFAQPFMGLLFRHLANPFFKTFRKFLYQNAVSL
jgi:hypothetical protein